MVIINLRERFRAETRRAHDASDRAFARFDLTDPDGVRGFLAAHRDAVTSLRKAEGSGPLAPALDAALAALDADLGALGHDAPAAPPAGPAADDPVARRYVWLASRLGTRMLTRHWRDATDPAVRAADAYLGQDPDRGEWRLFSTEAEDMPARGPDPDRILRAAKDWFAIFETTAHENHRKVRSDA